MSWMKGIEGGRSANLLLKAGQAGIPAIRSIQSGLGNLQGWGLQTPSSSTAEEPWKCSLCKVWMSVFSAYSPSSSQHTWLWGAWPSFQQSPHRHWQIPGAIPSLTKPAQLPQPLLTGQVLHPCLSWGTPLNLLQIIHVLGTVPAQIWMQFCTCGQT